MQTYRIRRATLADGGIIEKFYSKHKNEISYTGNIQRFLDGTTDIDFILMHRVGMYGRLGSVFAACAVLYWEENGIKYGTCNTGVVNKSMRLKGVSKILSKSCDVLFKANKCQKVIKIRNLFQKHINFGRLGKQNWKITIEGSMVILEKNL